MTTARATRQAMQLSALIPRDPLAMPSEEPTYELDADAVERLARGPKLRQPDWGKARGAGRVHDGELLHEWHKPLDALANAWSRLLSLVGWRR